MRKVAFLHTTTCLAISLVQGTVLVTSCKKKTKEALPIEHPIIAPCDLHENVLYSGWTNADTVYYLSDSISTVPDITVDSCHYYIRKVSGSLYRNMHLYFREEPASGKYLLSCQPALADAHSVYFRQELGAIPIIPMEHDFMDTIYVNNANDIITISFCDIVTRREGMAQTHILCRALIKVTKE
jgi:hypothetical protein